MSNSDLAPSLIFLIGRHRIDGASPERVADMHNVSVESVEQAWLRCQELLSQYFAQVEQRDYTLLNDIELQAKVNDVLPLLLDWREKALRAERFPPVEATTAESSIDTSPEEEMKTNDESNIE